MSTEFVPQKADLPDSMHGLNRFMNVFGAFKDSVEACVIFTPGLHIEARVKMEIGETIGSGVLARGLAFDASFKSLMDRFEVVRKEALKMGMNAHLVFHEEGVDKKFAKFKSRVVFEVVTPSRIVDLMRDMAMFFESDFEDDDCKIAKADLDNFVQNLFDSMIFSYKYKEDLPARTAKDNPMELNGILACLGEEFSEHNVFLSQNGPLFMEIKRMFDENNAECDEEADVILRDLTWFLSGGADMLGYIADGHVYDIDLFYKEIVALRDKALKSGAPEYQAFYRRMRDNFVEALRKNKLAHEEWKFVPNSGLHAFPEMVKINQILNRLTFHTKDTFD